MSGAEHQYVHYTGPTLESGSDSFIKFPYISQIGHLPPCYTQVEISVQLMGSLYCIICLQISVFKKKKNFLLNQRGSNVGINEGRRSKLPVQASNNPVWLQVVLPWPLQSINMPPCLAFYWITQSSLYNTPATGNEFIRGHCSSPSRLGDKYFDRSTPHTWSQGWGELDTILVRIHVHIHDYML